MTLFANRSHSNAARRVCLGFALLLAFVATTSCSREKEAAPVERDAAPAAEEADATPPNEFSIVFASWSESGILDLRKAAEGTNIRLETVSSEDFVNKDYTNVDMIFINAMGWRPTQEDKDLVAKLKETKLIVGGSRFFDFGKESNNADQEFLDSIGKYLGFSCEDNSYSFETLLVQELEKRTGKTLECDTPEKRAKFVVKDPVEPPPYGYFYRSSKVYTTREEFEKARDEQGRDLPEDAPRVALFGGMLQPFNDIERGSIDELCLKLEQRGFNVYPIYRMSAKNELLTDLKPDVALYFPMGPGFTQRDAVEALSEMNVPVLTGIALMTSEEDWRAAPMGATGGYYALTTAIPEMDGYIEPTAYSVRRPNEQGITVNSPLEERIDRIVERCWNWVALRRKANADKKIAIFYYKGAGSSALVAASLEVVDSIYNTLVRLRDEGYNLGDHFPVSKEELQERIMKEGRTVGQWELGTLDRFYDEAKPAFVPQAQYYRWFMDHVPEQARESVIRVWGVPPGKFMTRDVGDQFGMMVPRVQFGNVVLIPQPSSAVITDESSAYSQNDDDFQSIHGTDAPPPHFYIAAYLWARYGFNADAIIHYGTHGSLEFTQGKSAMMTENCFPDLLIGDKPHLYLYCISNIGEAYMAKRRSRAVIVSHLTPPFMKGDLYADLKALDDKLHEYNETDESALKDEYAASIAEATLKSNLVEDVLDDPHFREFRDPKRLEQFKADRGVFTDEQIQTIHKLLHQYEDANVTNGLHVIGRDWDEEEIRETAAASTIDPEDAANRIRQSFTDELGSFLRAANGEYIKPSTGGDFLFNPDAAPTGRNLAGINPEKLPTDEAINVAKNLTDDLIESYKSEHDGEWPRRIACTIWGGETVRTQGMGVAQAMYLLGVRFVRDSRGMANSIELIPSEELGRPRIDILIQSSGQFRDAFESKLEQIDKAVAMAANAPDDEPYENFVKKNTDKIAEKLVADGKVSLEEAKQLATARIFGSPNATNYGTGAQSLIERSDKWDSEEQIADRYIQGMSGVYRGTQFWGVNIPNLFEYNLDGVDIMTSSRSSNTWGPVSLDHVYEFSTLAAAVRAKTGNDPDIWFSDMRSPKNPKNQTARAAIREELRTSLWNPKYLKGLQTEGASAAEGATEMVRNLFGWCVAQPRVIDKSTWDETKEVLIDDKYDLGLREWFEEKNPAALQDMTAFMLEAVRKEFWKADEETVKQIAELHAELVEKYGPAGTYQTTGNRELQKFLGNVLPADVAAKLAEQIDKATTAPKPHIEGLGLQEVKEETNRNEDLNQPFLNYYLISVLLLMAIVCAAGFVVPRREERVFF